MRRYTRLLGGPIGFGDHSPHKPGSQEGPQVPVGRRPFRARRESVLGRRSTQALGRDDALLKSSCLSLPAVAFLGVLEVTVCAEALAGHLDTAQKDQPKLHPVLCGAARHRGQSHRAESATGSPAARGLPSQRTLEDFGFDVRPSLGG
jgi:hypothetical protein